MNVSKLVGGRWGVACSLLLAAVLIGGCHSSPPVKTFADVPGMTPAPPATQSSASPAALANIPDTPRGTNEGPLDILKVQDQVHVTFADLPPPGPPPIDDQVKQDGTITLLFNHTFHVAGRTRGDVEKEIHGFYVPDYFRNMTVTIRVLPASQFYYVLGEVKAPNRQIYVGPIKLSGAISSAGGFTDFASKRHVTLTRANGQKITVNAVKALKDPKLDPWVYPGDTINVPRTWM